MLYRKVSQEKRYCLLGIDYCSKVPRNRGIRYFAIDINSSLTCISLSICSYTTIVYRMHIDYVRARQNNGKATKIVTASNVFPYYGYIKHSVWNASHYFCLAQFISFLENLKEMLIFIGKRKYFQLRKVFDWLSKVMCMGGLELRNRRQSSAHDRKLRRISEHCQSSHTSRFFRSRCRTSVDRLYVIQNGRRLSEDSNNTVKLNFCSSLI